MDSLPLLDAPSRLALRDRAGYFLCTASGPDGRDRAGSLRYRAYLARGLIDPDVSGRFGDGEDTAPTATTFILYHGQRPVGSTRTRVVEAWPKATPPGLAAFQSALAATLSPEATLIEACHTVVAPDIAGEPKNALFLLFKAHFLQCLLENADWLLCAVREPEIGFYRRIFNMEILSGPEDYPGLRSRRVLMGLDYRRHSRLLSARIPALAITRDDHEEYLETGRIGFARGTR